jgi:hypothetical protein
MVHCCFPIIKQDEGGQLRLLGTGFLISTNGLFVTAKHVLMDVLDVSGKQRYPIGMLQFLPGNRFVQRPILRCSTNSKSDVAIGVAAPMKTRDGSSLQNKILQLTTIPAPVGARIVTYAFPKHAIEARDGLSVINVVPAWYDGIVEEYYPAGRDRVVLPARCYRTSMAIHGGASGGPVFTRSGWVFGVNSTGFDGTDVSYVSSVADVLGLPVDDVSLDDQEARRVMISELSAKGHVVWRPPLADVEGVLAHLGLGEKGNVIRGSPGGSA